jgi:hypothetical protein
MVPNKNIEKVKTQISNMSVPDKKVRKAVENLTTTRQQDKEEILALLKKKRPTFFSQWQLEIASKYM